MMTLKKIILCLSVITLLTAPGQAQEFRLVPFYGYTFQDRVPTYEGDFYIRDDSHFGGILQYLPNEYVAVDFMYRYSQPDLDFNSYSYYFDDIRSLKTNLSYYMFGITRFMSPNSEKVAPFGTFYMGWTTWNPQENYNSYSRFTMGFDIGASVRLTEHIGLNLRSELMMPITGFGAGIFCGSGGCGGSFSATTAITQFGFSGGIEIRLAPKESPNNSYTY